MNFLKHPTEFIGKLLHGLFQWLRHSHHAGWLTLVLAIGAAVYLISSGYQEAQLGEAARNNALAVQGELKVSEHSLHFVSKVLVYMENFALIGAIVLGIFLVRSWNHADRLIFPSWVAAVYLAVWAVLGHLYQRWQLESVTSTGEIFSSSAFFIQLGLLGFLILSIPVMVTYYAEAKILERYVMRSFLQPLLFCFIAFCVLWIVMDLLDNMQDFRENDIPLQEVVWFYLKLVPFIYVTVAPITLLLSTLYVLGRMSRTNELISILGAGKSMFQTLRPIYIIGLYASFLCMAANYYWAPVSAGNKEKLTDVKERLGQGLLMRGLVYKNQEDRRTWFIGSVPRDLKHKEMERIEIRQENSDGDLEKAWFSEEALWSAEKKEWVFFEGVEVDYKNGEIEKIANYTQTLGRDKVLVMKGWSETPWMLLSGSIIPDYLGVPEIISYLRANQSYDQSKLAPYWTHLYYRFALPWHCMVVVMFAAPLAVVFSRRGLVGGMARAVMFFFVLLFLDNMFLNLGKGQHIPPSLSVWIPHILLGSLGVYLFIMRSKNKEVPSLKSLFKKS